MKKRYFDIKLNLRELNSDIEYCDYIHNCGEQGSYLIMCKETAEELGCQLGVNTGNKINDDTGLIGMYIGHTILIDDRLPLGIIDIR